MYVYASVDGGDSWSVMQKLVAVGAADGDNFGWHVAIYETTIAISAYWDDNVNGIDAGKRLSP